MQEGDGKYMTVTEAAEVLGRSRRTVFNYIRKEKWETTSSVDDYNRQVTLVKKEDVERKIAERTGTFHGFPSPNFAVSRVSSQVPQEFLEAVSSIRELLENPPPRRKVLSTTEKVCYITLTLCGVGATSTFVWALIRHFS